MTEAGEGRGDRDVSRSEPVRYIERARLRGATAARAPHVWPHFPSAPLTLMSHPLSEARVGLITTASLMNPDGSAPPDDRPAMRFAARSEPAPTRLHTGHLGWDRDATHMEDLDSYFPLQRLEEFRAEGRIGSLSPRFYGTSRAEDGPQLVSWCHEDEVDAVVLVPI